MHIDGVYVSQLDKNTIRWDVYIFIDSTPYI